MGGAQCLLDARESRDAWLASRHGGSLLICGGSSRGRGEAPSGEHRTLEAAMAETHKAAERQVAGERGAGRAKRSTGRIQVRRDTAEYRAAAQEQAAKVREEIDTALEAARRMREEIEARIETQWHNRPASKVAGA